MVVVGTFCGTGIRLNGVVEMDVLSHRIAFALLAIYSFLVAGLAAYQANAMGRK
jgi:hypothetical protein